MKSFAGNGIVNQSVDSFTFGASWSSSSAVFGTGYYNSNGDGDPITAVIVYFTFDNDIC
jgi:hypothetical protein